MTPEETSLARLLVALPGFPTFDEIGGVHDVGDSGEGAPIWYANGLVWVGVDLVHGEWVRVPLLTHMGTAGILLGMLPPWHQSTRHEGVYEVTVYDCPPLPGAVVHSGPHGTAKWWTVSGDSLGVAAARALVAIGRAS